MKQATYCIHIQLETDQSGLLGIFICIRKMNKYWFPDKQS